MKKEKFILIILIFAGFLFGCDGSGFLVSDKEKIHSVSLVTWNLQTFFDGETVGTEFSEYKKRGSWNSQMYSERLDRLCTVISESDADIYAFEELENAAIFQDISNRLAGKSWRSKDLWKYAAFCKTEGSAFGCGVLSKYPLSDLKSHTLDIRKGNQPEMRPLLEVTVHVEEKEFDLFVNHWKSMSGGEEKTEVWREWQESVLSATLTDAFESGTKTALICGDFNRDFSKFSSDENGNTILRYKGFGNNQDFKVTSVWNFFEGETGSYYFRDEWSRIDNIFFAGSVILKSFNPIVSETTAYESGIPKGYKIYTGKGTSDHLPLFCEFEF